MDKDLGIEIVPVANGFLVRPMIGANGLQGYGNVHVFTVLGSLQRFIGEHFTPGPEEERMEVPL